jgi:hypothetical protein
VQHLRGREAELAVVGELLRVLLAEQRDGRAYIKTMNPYAERVKATDKSGNPVDVAAALSTP